MRFYIRSWVFFRQKVWTSLALAWLRLEPQWRVVEPLNLFGSTRHVSSRHTVNSGVEWWSIHYVTDFSRQYRLHRGCWSALMFDLREDFGSFFFVIFRGPPDSSLTKSVDLEWPWWRDFWPRVRVTCTTMSREQASEVHQIDGHSVSLRKRPQISLEITTYIETKPPSLVSWSSPVWGQKYHKVDRSHRRTPLIEAQKMKVTLANYFAHKLLLLLH